MAGCGTGRQGSTDPAGGKRLCALRLPNKAAFVSFNGGAANKNEGRYDQALAYYYRVTATVRGRTGAEPCKLIQTIQWRGIILEMWIKTAFPLTVCRFAHKPV
jgi:hypothetical protein